MFLDLLKEKIYYSYENNESKKTVVYIHGLGGKASFFESYKEFENREYNILAFDLIGRGLSSWNQEISVDLWLENIHEVLNKLNVNEFVLLAHSFGCYLATEIINSNKYNILDNLLICPYNGFINFKEPFIEKIASIYPMSKLKNLDLKNIYEELNVDVLKSFKIDCYDHYLYSKPLLSKFIDKEFYKNELTKSYLNAGTLNIIGGNNDPIVPPYSLEKLKEYNNNKVAMFDGEHTLIISASKKINEKINEIIKKCV